MSGDSSNNWLFGPYGATSAETASHVADCGGNAIWFHGFNQKGFEAAEVAGVFACVEYKTFRASYEEHPELKPIGVDGKPIRYGRLVQGVCLSQTDYVEERHSELERELKRYSPHGVWLDYLTYSGWFESPKPDLQESCFCPRCIDDFCRSESIDAQSPDEILKNHQDAWTRHKCDRIDAHGRRFAQTIRSADRSCLVGAYMCPWTPTEYDNALSRIFAQDYARFGAWLDVATPLFYAEKSGRPPGWSKEFLERSRSFIPGHVGVQPILDDLDFPDSMEALKDSTVAPLGFQLFAGARAFDDENDRKKIAATIDALTNRR